MAQKKLRTPAPAEAEGIVRKFCELRGDFCNTKFVILALFAFVLNLTLQCQKKKGIVLFVQH